jgi:hypothetical protein
MRGHLAAADSGQVKPAVFDLTGERVPGRGREHQLRAIGLADARRGAVEDRNVELLVPAPFASDAAPGTTESVLASTSV